MADRLEWYDITVPAATPITAPVTFPLVFPDAEVVEIDVKILDGPCGSLGFHINAGGSQYVPRTPGAFIRPNDDYFTWPLDNAINSGSWGLTAYNLDSWDHNIQVGFQVNERGLSAGTNTGGIGTVSADVLAAVPGLQASTILSTDPLSPDAILQANSPAALDLLASQLPVVPVIGVLSDVGAS